MGLFSSVASLPTTSLTLLNGETITNATDGEVQITATTLKLIGTASTSALIVGDEPPRQPLMAWSSAIVLLPM